MGFNEDSKKGLPFLYLLYLKSCCHMSMVVVKKTQKNTTFVRFSDYYLDNPLWGHSFQISLH
jgi:hypothetical protein